MNCVVPMLGLFMVGIPSMIQAQTQVGGQTCVDKCLASLYAKFSAMNVRGTFDFLREVDSLCTEHSTVMDCVSECTPFEGQEQYLQTHDMAAYACTKQIRPLLEAAGPCWQAVTSTDIDVLAQCRQTCMPHTNKTMSEWTSKQDMSMLCAVELCIEDCVVLSLQSQAQCTAQHVRLFVDYHTHQMQQQFADMKRSDKTESNHNQATDCARTKLNSPAGTQSTKKNTPSSTKRVNLITRPQPLVETQKVAVDIKLGDDDNGLLDTPADSGTARADAFCSLLLVANLLVLSISFVF